MSLPHSDDWNYGTEPFNGNHANYCTSPDNYKHCTGAKIWLVPSSGYDTATKSLTTWVPSNYLFETDLIAYTKGTDNKITLLANGGGVDFVVENALASNLESDVYTIKTDVSPA
jgi:hypothetical protein